jgi:serine/threonine protein phosphatase PrpC
VKLSSFGITDIGNVRSENQDSYAIQNVPSPENINSVLAVVADGVGGGKAGSVASLTAVEALKEICLNSTGDSREIIKKALQSANTRIFEKSNSEELCRGMATTCTALMIKGESVTIGHVGDSRAYLIRDGKITLLTEDHTLPRKLFRSGLIGKNDIERHPQGNVLTNALGSREEVDPDTVFAELQDQDIFLLCSDGLYKYLNFTELLETVNEAGVEASPEKLVAIAKERGGDDNITVVIVQAIEEEGFDKTREITGSYVPSAPPKGKRQKWKLALSVLFIAGFIYLVYQGLAGK